MSCPNPFDRLRMKTEDLGPTLYARASYKDNWLSLIPRDEYPQGAGLNRSAFTVQRSEPASDEETWPAIAVTATEGYLTANACDKTWNDTDVGYLERVYGPSGFGLRGPVVCQDDLALHWQSREFWDRYFQALEKRNLKSVINRLANEYMNFAPVVPATTGFLTEMTDPLHYTSQVVNVEVPPAAVDLSGLPDPTLTQYCELTQEMLDMLAQWLIEEGATAENSNGWITWGDVGPVFTGLIGMEASQRILLNNSEFRQDVRDAFSSAQEINPLLKRRGASQIIKNWRHLVTLTPPRWDYVDAAWVRRPVYVQSTNAADVTKGESAEINPAWRTAEFEGFLPQTPWVMREEILRPINSMANMKWQAQNYLGEWQFVTGNDAFLGLDSCAGIADPLHKKGRHFAEYRHAVKPLFPQFGSWILFKRCLATPTCTNCS